MKPSLSSRAPALAALLFAAAAVPLPAVDLKVDINDRDVGNNIPANTEGGFTAMAMNTAPANGQSGTLTRTFGAQTVTITSSVPGVANYDDRKRIAPVNQGTFNQQALLQDFIFGVYNATTAITEGINVEIAGLVAGKEYQITIWSFDTDSNGTRVSDWSANGVLKVDNYTFDGRVEPAVNEERQMNFTSVANGAGNILIEARRDATSVDAASAASHGVFLNALWVRDLFVDVDNDNMADGWESAHGLDPADPLDFDDDPDVDSSDNIQEFGAQTDPQDPDSDNDTLLDGYENKSGTWVSAVNTGTNPLAADSDGDGLGDALENPDLLWTGPSQPGTNPNLVDSDGDTFSDGEEINWPSHPRDAVEFPNPGAGATLAIDFESTAISAQPGFSVMDPSSGWTGNYGAQIVTVTATNTATLDHRDRAAASGGGGFNPMFRDFVFAASSDLDGDGLDVTITNLEPLTYYPVTLWSWDPTSAGTARHSTWLASDGDGPPVVKVPLYIHVGAALPTGAADRRMKFDALSDSFGQLVIQGRKEDGYTGSTINVFLNSLVIGPPVTPLRFTAIGPVTGGGFPLTWSSDAFGVYRVQTSPDLTLWQTLDGAVDGQAGTTSFTDTTAPAGTTRRFYKVDRVSP